MSTQAETVVLIHGLYLHGFCMELLARRLRRAGYRTLSFSYPSLGKTVTESADLLAQRLMSLELPAVHFVAHSLGGLVVRCLVATTPTLKPGRVVTLGTPHQGSQVARVLSNGKLRRVLGRSEPGLLGELPPWPTEWALGSIAGTLNAGLGKLITPIAEPADGTVTVAETQLPEMTDHICLPVSHSSMLLSAKVAEQVSYFLANGRFQRQEAG
ncbi:MAG: alpha/beta fold hydrolase [Candidatus Competibacteraceae bacterium]|jgi:pimeloyl-ACP methyl ester carboxylesterase|nr:alpha/beta fold hydrolase [Candidatus Competibacteraceae bacterium]